MFKINDNEMYEAYINGIKFICEKQESGYEDKANKIADIYYSKLNEIADFMISEGLFDMYDSCSNEEIIKKIGDPEIDLDLNQIVYVDQQFDDEHIFTIEFDGLLEELLYFIVDG